MVKHHVQVKLKLCSNINLIFLVHNTMDCLFLEKNLVGLVKFFHCYHFEKKMKNSKYNKKFNWFEFFQKMYIVMEIGVKIY